jgi:hypothetical protein
MERCLDIREIAALAGCPADDPRRRHLERCVRCRGLAEAHALFLEPGDTGDLDGLADADIELQRRLEAGMNVVPLGRPRARRRRATWYAAAAVLAVCALGILSTDLARWRPGSLPAVGQRHRGGETAGLTVAVADDLLLLSWPDVPAADTFDFVFFDTDLEEVTRLSAAGPNLETPVTSLPARVVWCQALAVASGDTIARSDFVALPLIRD